MPLISRALVFVALPLLLAGCASVTRDTWTGADAQLQQTHQMCLATANSDTLGAARFGAIYAKIA